MENLYGTSLVLTVMDVIDLYGETTEFTVAKVANDIAPDELDKQQFKLLKIRVWKTLKTLEAHGKVEYREELTTRKSKIHIYKLKVA